MTSFPRRTPLACAVLLVTASLGWSMDAAGAASRTYVVEGESLTVPAKVGGAAVDATAGGGRVLTLSAPGSATAKVTGKVAGIILRVRGQQCHGSPRIRIRFDGRVLATRTIRRDRWGRIKLQVGGKRTGGSHGFSFAFVGQSKRSPKCHRSVSVDWVAYTAARASTITVVGAPVSVVPPGVDPDGPTPGTTAATATPPATSAGGTSPSAPGGDSGGSGGSKTPLRVTKLFVDPNTYAVKQAAAWRSSRPGDAALIDKIASQPQAVWLSGSPDDVRVIDLALKNAAATSSRAVFSLYGIPGRDCGQYSTGGLAASAYLTWVKQLAAHIGSRPALVVLEPDALGQITCLTAPEAAERNSLLSSAIGAFRALADTPVYLDAGNSSWVKAADMASRLRAGGVGNATGFALDVANFQTTAAEVAYGRTIASQIGGKPFVIDTSRNGRGPLPGATGEAAWCNPVGRGLGARPTMSTGLAGVDAFLWVKRPGETDGPCGGGPVQGWYADYALALAKNASW